MQLLSVPRYADLLDPDVDEVDGDENGGKRSFLIPSPIYRNQSFTS